MRPASSLLLSSTLATICVAAHAQSTARVSVDVAGLQLPGGAASGAISGDGTHVAFSALDGVVPGDTNGFEDLFVRDLLTGILRRVSITGGGVQPNGNCFQPAMSDDGRYVAFSSWASNLAPSDANGSGTDIFVKDLLTGSIEHVSVSSTGAGADGICHYPDISGDGRYVTFYSYATNLVPGDLNGQQDTFLHDRATGVTECLSIDPLTGAPAGGGAASISDDGRIVAFETWAPLFGPATPTIAVLDRQTGATTPVATGPGGAPLLAVDADVSGDGGAVLFSTLFALVPDDQDVGRDVYAYDVASGALSLLTPAPSGGSAGLDCFGGGLSRDGRYAAFSTAAAYVADDVNGLWDVYVVDRATGAIELATPGHAGQASDGDSRAVGLSADGRRCVVQSEADDLVADDTNGAPDVFVRDRCPPARWTSYGAGYPGTGGVVPGFALLGDPAIGATTSIVVANNTGAPSLALLALGEQPAATPTPFLGTLLVDPIVASAHALPTPALLLAVPIPGVFALCGSRFYLQALVLDAAAPAGVAFTRGIEAVIGG